MGGFSSFDWESRKILGQNLLSCTVPVSRQEVELGSTLAETFRAYLSPVERAMRHDADETERLP
jgi:hypothetical protein